MSYRLLIVDDEEHIREGLNDLIDWTSLGFQVVATLEDGKQAMEWLQKTDIDVILSDIKMTLVSGLELAQFVHEHYNRTKIVLISGFKEFEFIKQAMSYNVINYLLKPTKLGDIVSVFQDVKKRLDKDRDDQVQLSKVLKQKNELLPAIRKQLFRDLSTGKSIDPSEAEKLLRLTEIRANTSDHKCALARLTFSLPNLPSSAASHEHFSVEAVENMIRNEVAGILYMPVLMNREHLNIVALSLQKDQDIPSLQTAILSYLETAVQRMRGLLGIESTPEIMTIFESLQELIEKKRDTLPAVSDDLLEFNPAELPAKEKVQISELRRQFLVYFSAGNMEALPGQYEKLLHAADQGRLPISNAKNMLVELFSFLCSKLNEMNLPIDKITNRPFYYETILRMNGYPELLQWGFSLLEDISGYFQKKGVSEPSMIQKVKEYVAAHYDKDISLESAASHVYLSPDYFSRVFKQYTGNSFTDFVGEFRITKALEFLQDPQLKVYEIGSIVGYKSPKYFFKLFKKHTGYTPSEYRRKSLTKDT